MPAPRSEAPTLAAAGTPARWAAAPGSAGCEAEPARGQLSERSRSGEPDLGRSPRRSCRARPADAAELVGGGTVDRGIAATMAPVRSRVTLAVAAPPAGEDPRR